MKNKNSKIAMLAITIIAFAISSCKKHDMDDGDTVSLDPYTTEVEVTATAVDENATVEIVGGMDLQPGENALTVTVTAVNGDVAEYNVTLNVLLGNNVELAIFQVNGTDVQDGDTVDLDPYTTEVEVVAEASEVDATVEISGGSDLQSGENTLTVTVTAADGETTASYTVVLNVLLSANTALATFQVNGSDVQDGDTVELDPYTTEVEVTVETVDENATVEIAGGSELQSGENTLTVTVTAPNGDVAEYNVILLVALGNNTELASFQVNGNDVADGDTVELDPYVTEVEVVATAVDENATVEISGGSELQPGDNSLTVTVTAPNGDVAEYTVTLVVALGNNVELASFQVNGSDVADGDTVDLAACIVTGKQIGRASCRERV